MDVIAQAFHTADNPMVVVLDGKVVEANRALVEHSGFDEEEIIGRPFTDFVADGEMAGEIHLKRLMGKEIPNLVRMEMKGKDGAVPANLLISKVTVGESVGIMIVMELVEDSAP